MEKRHIYQSPKISARFREVEVQMAPKNQKPDFRRVCNLLESLHPRGSRGRGVFGNPLPVRIYKKLRPSLYLAAAKEKEKRRS